MKTKATGTSMNSTIINTRNKVKPVLCNCSRCSYKTTKGDIKYCTYYDIFSPNKKFCLRYSGPAIIKKGKNKRVEENKNTYNQKAIAKINKKNEKDCLKICTICKDNQDGFCLKEKLWCNIAREYCEVIKEAMKNTMTLGQYWKKEREKKKRIAKKLKKIAPTD